jgi:hypothetical protein
MSRRSPRNGPERRSEVPGRQREFQQPLEGVEINAPKTIGFYLPGGTGPVAGTEIDPSKQFSEEMSAASTGDGRLNWVGGFFMSRFWSTWIP